MAEPQPAAPPSPVDVPSPPQNPPPWTPPADVPPQNPPPPADPAPSLPVEAPPRPTSEGSLIGDAALPAAPSFEAYTLPEGVSLGETEITELNRIIGDAELSPQQRGQALVDLAAAEINRLQQGQHDVFQRTREGWRNQFFDDPEIGGNQQDTTLRQAASMRDRFAGNPEQRADFIAALNYTGMGDHPAFIRFLANVAKALAAPRLIGASPAPERPTDGPSRRYPSMVNLG